MNNIILAARKPVALARVWHTTGEAAMPLVCSWVQTDTAKQPPAPANSSDETGGLRLCA